MTFSHFHPQTISFLQSIRDNGSSKEFFKEKTSDYETIILNYTRAFVMEMGEHLQALVPTINALPKVNGSLFRIYRDVRFSKDKTAIKSRVGVIFWQGRAKRMQSSCFYLHFSPDELFFSAGVRGFDKPLLDAYREYIKDETKAQELSDIIKELHEKGYHIIAPKYKRLPRTFDAEYKFPELTKYASMAAFYEEDKELLFSKDIINISYKHFENMYKLHMWVYEMSLQVKEDN